MGQGQEVHARRLISVSTAEVRRALLQICHPGLDFMDELLETVRVCTFFSYFFYTVKYYCVPSIADTGSLEHVTSVTELGSF